MAFYDSVKHDVRAEHGDEDGDDDVSFDQLKEGAEDEPEEGGDDTTIEVLTDDGLEPADGGAPVRDEDQADTGDASPEPATDASPDAGRPDAAVGADVAMDEVAATLEAMQDQQEEMLAVLRDIRQALQ